MLFNELHSRTPIYRQMVCCVLWGALAAGFDGNALAQTIYRSVDAKGRVVFSDKPPVAATTTSSSPDTSPSTALNAGTALPFALRQVVSQYPVTLYTSKDCAPCDGGRTWLQEHGVPFTEKTINTNDDAAALQRLSGQISLPLLTVGSQHIQGYSNTEWSQYIHAAGYPETSQLPSGYRNPPATPLTTIAKPAPARANKAAAPPSVPAPLPAIVDNPAGIQF